MSRPSSASRPLLPADARSIHDILAPQSVLTEACSQVQTHDQRKNEHEDREHASVVVITLASDGRDPTNLECAPENRVELVRHVARDPVVDEPPHAHHEHHEWHREELAADELDHQHKRNERSCRRLEEFVDGDAKVLCQIGDCSSDAFGSFAETFTDSLGDSGDILGGLRRLCHLLGHRDLGCTGFGDALVFDGGLLLVQFREVIARIVGSRIGSIGERGNERQNDQEQNCTKETHDVNSLN